MKHDNRHNEILHSMMLFWRAIYQAFATRLSKYGMQYNAANVLMMIYGNPGFAEPAQLSEVSSVPRQTMTSILDGLEKAGLIKRQPHPNDRRKKQIVISKSGEKLATTIIDDMIKFEKCAQKAAGPVDMSVVREWMTKYAQSLNTQNGVDADRFLPSGRNEVGI